MATFPTLKDSWPWPWIGSYCIPSCITRRPLPTRQISLKSKELFVDRQTYARTYVFMYVRTHGRTFETSFIRSTLSKSRPKNAHVCTYRWRRRRPRRDPLPVDHPCRGTCHSAHTWPASTGLTSHRYMVPPKNGPPAIARHKKVPNI